MVNCNCHPNASFRWSLPLKAIVECSKLVKTWWLCLLIASMIHKRLNFLLPCRAEVETKIILLGVTKMTALKKQSTQALNLATFQWLIYGLISGFIYAIYIIYCAIYIYYVCVSIVNWCFRNGKRWPPRNAGGKEAHEVAAWEKWKLSWEMETDPSQIFWVMDSWGAKTLLCRYMQL